MAALEKRPRLIATDLDGTIVAHYGVITDRTKAAITSAHNNGIEIFFVTGRPPRWMNQIKEAFDFGQAICSNGGLLWDLHEEKVLEEWRITPADLRTTITKLRNAVPDIYFAIYYLHCHCYP